MEGIKVSIQKNLTKALLFKFEVNDGNIFAV